MQARNYLLAMGRRAVVVSWGNYSVKRLEGRVPDRVGMGSKVMDSKVIRNKAMANRVILNKAMEGGILSRGMDSKVMAGEGTVVVVVVGMDDRRSRVAWEPWEGRL